MEHENNAKNKRLAKYPAYMKIYYAKIKGVSPPRITALINEGRLITRIEEDKEKVIDCPENNECFKNASHARGGNRAK